MKKAVTLKLIILFVLCFTCFNRAEAKEIEPKEANSLRIMSYNVKNCSGMDNVTDYQRIADVINRVTPDVVAVQELDSATQRSQGVFVLKELAERTLKHWTYAPAIDYQGGRYGVGVLSKEKPLGYKMVPLPGREEQRMLLIVEFEKYVFCCTHFSLTKEDQELSVPIIFDAIKGIQKPLFLAGDMNTVYDSPTQVALREKFKTLNNYKENTIPVVNPNRCIDFIYGYENGNTYSVLKRRVLFEEQVASDHLPLFVDVRLSADKAAIMRTKPYLQNPVDGGMTVSWLTNVPVYSWVEYGTDKNLELKKDLIVDGQIICNNTRHKIRLTDLKPGQTYYYRVCSREITLYEAYKKEFGDTAYSETYSFTMPGKEGDFKAVIFNDLHKKNDVLDLLAKQIKGVDYDFVIFNGDCIDDPKNEKQAVYYLSYMNETVGAERKPVFYIRGNHEIRNAYSIQLRDLFDYVGDKTYSAFNWQDTRFVILDCGEDKPDSTWVYYNLNNFEQLRLDQVGFLKNELNSKAFKSAKKKVLVHHIPTYGMPSKSYLPCAELWNPLLSKAPFNVCLNGHTHRYAYHPKGSVGNNYPVVIGGGNRVETATVMLLERQGNTLSLKVMNTKGEKILDIVL
ncbi:endonuclease/exonuclease/phosphatase family protein [Massilibacteroides sp.]|uniref:metallophosphoesterase n=1 Tax=Massilibacteroides sp. TaxID=2034766 RepID=UPI00262D0059|nr:endonuclease/exonuclease/phosphatase family protein [Massilibacteroides sp.]MDD4514380.1 metallophosphoesterase [Massilibacteroides sp.]